jgi:hypothetical protein
VKPIEARAAVAAPREALYARLADLRDHWRMAGRWVEPLELRPDGGVVRLRGPLGVHRTVRTELHESVPYERLAGEASVGATRAAISWTLAEDGAQTFVTLRADVLSVTPWDRLLLALGGRAWLRHRFATTLARLSVG